MRNVYNAMRKCVPPLKTYTSIVQKTNSMKTNSRHLNAGSGIDQRKYRNVENNLHVDDLEIRINQHGESERPTYINLHQLQLNLNNSQPTQLYSLIPFIRGCSQVGFEEWRLYRTTLKLRQQAGFCTSTIGRPASARSSAAHFESRGSLPSATHARPLHQWHLSISRSPCRTKLLSRTLNVSRTKSFRWIRTIGFWSTSAHQKCPADWTNMKQLLWPDWKVLYVF